MSAGQFGWSYQRVGLYRDVTNAKIAGVCAGLGAYFQINPKFVRIAAIVTCFFGLFPAIILGYILLALLLPVAPSGGVAAATPRQDSWRRGATPDATDALADRFKDLDRRLAEMEARVTSDEFKLRQEFRNL